MANQSLTVWLNNEGIKKKIAERLGKNAPAFTSALASVYSGNQQLQNCDGRSILGAAFLAATLNLSITPSLGQAYIVPFKGKAQFQVGARGYVQLAHRSGQYTRLHAGKVYEGELRGFNPLTGEPILGEKTSDEVAGYVAYMRLVNGFEKTLYMTKSEIEAFAKKYSQSYGKSYSPWSTNFDEMASKTVLKKLLRSWGVLSADLATALAGDQSVVDRDTFTYNDNGNGVQNRDEVYLPEEQAAVDADTGEVIETEAVTNEAD
ncbi:MAG: recombinase RecT [Selenomonadaceae bacterium]|nr:recombinase RecT [Selenomonadaceae bacterium]